MAETLRFGVSTMLVSTERDGYLALMKRLEEVAEEEWLTVLRESTSNQTKR